jgi:oligopeptide/dipeptide ABC transporter ATP-binding protein
VPDPRPAPAAGEPLLAVDDLRVEFAGARPVRAVRGLSYTLAPGEALGLVGESGSGKSVSALSLLRLLPAKAARITSGTAHFGGVDLLAIPQAQLEDIRGDRVGFVFQDPLVFLNPVLTVGEQISESLRRHRGAGKAEAADRATHLLELVGIPNARARLKDYPHQFSGGMRQRAMIAMALACDPVLLIADEPTTALDVTIQAQILDLLRELRREQGMALLIITHDLGVVAGITDRLAVMYAGRVVETGPTRDLLRAPRHPYTSGLLRSLPRLDQPRQAELLPIEGSPPDLAADLRGCPFRPRCARALDRCATDDPAMEPAGPARSVACWNPVPAPGSPEAAPPDRAAPPEPAPATAALEPAS